MATVRLHRRRIELSWGRWLRVRRHHPKRPQSGVTANGVRTVASSIPFTEYALSAGRLHSGPDLELERTIRERLVFAVQQAEERAVQEPGVLDTRHVLHTPDGVFEYYEEHLTVHGRAR